MIDENDEIPMFVGLNENGRYSGNVAENSSPGTSVIRVSATDRDARTQYARVSISILALRKCNNSNGLPTLNLLWAAIVTFHTFLCKRDVTDVTRVIYSPR